MESEIRKIFKTVDEYIASQPESVGKTLELLRQTIRRAAPEAEEVISYQIPAYIFHGILVYFAAFKEHYSLFAMPTAISAFKDKLKPYEVSKGTIRFPLYEIVPVNLITEIIKFRMKENLEKKRLKEEIKKNKIKKN